MIYIHSMFTALFLFISCFTSLEAISKSDSDQTICLNMIVKNESKIIERCLASTLPIVDYWVIVDTGSTDGTQDVIKNFMSRNHIPGELHERPWVNFSHNRNEALTLAKGKTDYILIIDADEFLKYEEDFKLPKFESDYYYITTSYSGTQYRRIQLLNNQLDWKFVGVLHEVIDPGLRRSGFLDKVMNIPLQDGARSKDPLKYLKDAQLLETALIEEPDNRRYVFYLAQSYRDAGEKSLALKNYEKRVAMGGWPEEVYWSLLQIATLQEGLNMPPATFINSYNRAYQYRPSRLEPLYHLAHYYRSIDDFETGYQIGKLAMTIPQSKDSLFIQQWMYDYGVPLDYSICAYWTDRFDVCEKVSLDMLKNKNLPQNIIDCVERNLGFARAKLIENLCKKDLPAKNLETSLN